MQISPLLPKDTVKHVCALLTGKGKSRDAHILAALADFPLEEKIHVLRFLYNKLEGDDTIAYLYRIWRSLVPLNHPLNTEEHRSALYEIGQWWDAFGCREGMTLQSYDVLEHQLDRLGMTAEGRTYFTWVALYPVGIEEGLIWDEHRRGAIVCLGKYAYCKETEFFLARHLDDWSTIQIEAVLILAALKSRLLAKLAPWYLIHDDGLKPLLEEYF